MIPNTFVSSNWNMDPPNFLGSRAGYSVFLWNRISYDGSAKYQFAPTGFPKSGDFVAHCVMHVRKCSVDKWLGNVFVGATNGKIYIYQIPSAFGLTRVPKSEIKLKGSMQVIPRPDDVPRLIDIFGSYDLCVYDMLELSLDRFLVCGKCKEVKLMTFNDLKTLSSIKMLIRGEEESCFFKITEVKANQFAVCGVRSMYILKIGESNKLEQLHRIKMKKRGFNRKKGLQTFSKVESIDCNTIVGLSGSDLILWSLKSNMVQRKLQRYKYSKSKGVARGWRGLAFYKAKRYILMGLEGGISLSVFFLTGNNTFKLICRFECPEIVFIDAVERDSNLFWVGNSDGLIFCFDALNLCFVERFQRKHRGSIQYVCVLKRVWGYKKHFFQRILQLSIAGRFTDMRISLKNPNL